MDIQERKIVDYNYQLITVTEDVIADAEVAAIVEKIMLPYKNMQQEQVGNTDVILHRYNTLEASMDNLLLSAIQSAAKSDVAFSNGWRYGAPVNKGVITKWDLYNIIPMNPVISTVELTGEEIINMLEENLERTFSPEPMKQMGGYVKRCIGLHVKMRIENPKGNRIQQIFIGDEPLIKEKSYKASFVTSQGVPEKFGTNRKDMNVKAVEAMATYLKETGDFSPMETNTFSLV